MWPVDEKGSGSESVPGMKRLLTVLALLCLCPVLASSNRAGRARASGQHSTYVWPTPTDTNAVANPAQKLQLIEGRITALKAELRQLEKQQADLRKSLAKGPPKTSQPQDKFDNVENADRSLNAEIQSGKPAKAEPLSPAPGSPVLRRYQEKFLELEKENTELNERYDALAAIIQTKKQQGTEAPKEEREYTAIREQVDKNAAKMSALDAAIQDLKKPEAAKR